MIVSTQIIYAEIFALTAVLVFKLLSHTFNPFERFEKLCEYNQKSSFSALSKSLYKSCIKTRFCLDMEPSDENKKKRDPTYFAFGKNVYLIYYQQTSHINLKNL